MMKRFAPESIFDRNARGKCRSANDGVFVRANPFDSLTSQPFIHRKASCACGGGCLNCQAKSSDLKVSQPNDAAELEADHIADAVMRMPGKASSSLKQDTVPSLPRSAVSPSAQPKSKSHAVVSGKLSGPITSSRGVGSGMDRDTLSFMQDRFGTDFSGVRIHTGGEAVQRNRELNAEAFTFGSDIYFSEGAYRPSSTAGRRLLAHELTHVVQTAAGGEIMLHRQPLGGGSGPSSALTSEEQRVSKAAGFLTSASNAAAPAFTAALNQAGTEALAEKVVKQTGEQLWQSAAASARAGGSGTDDRQLYWTRLTLTAALRQWNPSWVPNAASLERLRTRLISLLEQTSRGMTTTAFPTDSPDLKRILISGFDPFGFPNSGSDIRQSNLSGAAAIALDGVTLTQGTVSARIEGVVFPVRYADFDDSIVENHLRPHLSGKQPPHLVMSISQGGNLFEFEETAGRRRSTGNYKDNLGVTIGSTTAPVVPPGLAAGSEFLSHSVPAGMLKSMRGAEGRKGAISEETTVKDLPPGAKEPRTLPGGPGKSTNPAVEGAGGGFLSNEIFYRNSRLRTQLGSTVPMIHLHTPTLPPTAGNKARNDLIERIRAILRAAISQL
jgi:pyrrolidone-carboxylate peptidase